MSIEAIGALGTAQLQAITAPQANTALAAIVPDIAPREAMSFETLAGAFESLNQKLVASSDAVHALALGQVDNLHQVMIANEETRLAFDLMLQVRGKVLDAYQELLRMQV